MLKGSFIGPHNLFKYRISPLPATDITAEIWNFPVVLVNMCKSGHISAKANTV